MATFLERYVAGDRQQVWDDLLALGARVRDEGVYNDALAVARQTMRQARHNIETVIPRLGAVGYRLGYDWLDEEEHAFAVGQPLVFALPKADARERIDELETAVGPLPLALRAWYETVGMVNLVGAAPPTWQMDGREDPLYVYPIEAVFEEYVEWREAQAVEVQEETVSNPGPFRVPIAPDYLHKRNFSGGMWYHILAPDPTADRVLEAERHAVTFVAYLRICFRWGGFPGLDQARWLVPREDLAFLTQDLVPL
jgi:hypothetical protein